ncbi:MAG TPA: formylglycine-generating enzyme family protein [Polyangiaceae bacterium]|nr:formylglycine-generating enzyme family protein [Polyangiaceae bacterium]
MACIPGATFTFSEDDPAGTKTRVATVKTFYLDLTEVTFGAFTECVEQGRCSPPDPPSTEEPSCVWGTDAPADYPVNCVTWFAARDYCLWRHKRLPTEEEWDYAARRGTTANPWGDAPATHAQLNLLGDEWTGGASAFGNDGFVYLAPVGSYPLGATPEGIQDLGGNVWEFTESKYCPYPQSPCSSCPLDEVCDNPCDACPDLPHQWVHRGGGWADYPDANRRWLRWRGYAVGGGRSGVVGFRCAKSR